jgi:glycosyltransferase involved in cell wall biosynthesis
VYPIPPGSTDQADRHNAGSATDAIPHSIDALFVGDLTYRPNLEAFTFLEEQVMPEVWKHNPNFLLTVVGKHTFGSRQFDPRIHVKGSVESVTEFLDKATMVVAPLRSGGGTRIKILEAFAHQIPVVATSVGCEGLAVDDEVHLLIADTVELFAQSMLRLFQNPDLRNELIDSGFKLFMTRYTFSALKEVVCDVLSTAQQKSFLET